MSRLLLLRPTGKPLQTPPPPLQGGPWAFWSAGTIADACKCPQRNVERNWPLIHAELVRRGIGDRLVQAAALGTVSIETARTFEPVREAFWMSEEWRRANLSRYYPFYGRGFIQLTWNGPTIFNYRNYGRYVGADLEGNPDLALDPDIAARVFGEFFLRAGVAAAARVRDWAEVRRRVQGAHAGLDRLVAIVNELEATGRGATSVSG